MLSSADAVAPDVAVVDVVVVAGAVFSLASVPFDADVEADALSGIGAGVEAEEVSFGTLAALAVFSPLAMSVVSLPDS